MAKGKTDAERTRAVLDDIVGFTLKLPDVVESTSYGKPALKRGEKLIFALRDADTLSLTCSFEERAILLKDHKKSCNRLSGLRGNGRVLGR